MPELSPAREVVEAIALALDDVPGIDVDDRPPKDDAYGFSSMFAVTYLGMRFLVSVLQRP